MLYEKYPVLDVYNDSERLLNIAGSYYMCKYLDGMLDAICSVYKFPPCTFIKEEIAKREQRRVQSRTSAQDHASQQSASRLPNTLAQQAAIRKVQQQASDKIDQLKSNLTQKDSMLQDLQDNFDSQLADSKVTALMDFFAQLNSDRYGNILDMVLQLRKGVATLSKSGYELPEELNGLFMLYNKLVQFIRDSHIDPIRKIGSQATVHASDIEFCIYEGTPFTSEDEIKLVETISPGWIYKDRNIQISRPKVKEVIIEEIPQDEDVELSEKLCIENAEPTEMAEVQHSDIDETEKELHTESAEIAETPQLFCEKEPADE